MFDIHGKKGFAGKDMPSLPAPVFMAKKMGERLGAG
jgi:hypothetical protein